VAQCVISVDAQLDSHDALAVVVPPSVLAEAEHCAVHSVVKADVVHWVEQLVDVTNSQSVGSVIVTTVPFWSVHWSDASARLE
jgi:hypothetical protein